MEFLANTAASLGLMTPHCANEFFLKFNLFRAWVISFFGWRTLTPLLSADMVCLKLLISKALSAGIIAGSFLLKVPQIVTMRKARSAAGLTFTMFISEVFLFATGGSYGYRQGFPLSTYLENWVILAQVVIICVLMFHYRQQPAPMVAFLAAVAAYIGYMTLYAPLAYVDAAFSAVIPIMVYGRAPQIYYNFRAKNTGTLSLTSLLMSFGGGLARIFTTLQEAPSTLILAGYVIGVTLNGILVLQILIYGGGTGSGSGTKKRKAKKE